MTFPSVKRLLLGGGELHPTLARPLRHLLPNAAVWTAYGMTECASSITTAPADLLPVGVAGGGGGEPQLGGSPVGRPPKGIEAAICQLTDEHAVPSQTPRTPTLNPGTPTDSSGTPTGFMRREEPFLRLMSKRVIGSCWALIVFAVAGSEVGSWVLALWVHRNRGWCGGGFKVM